MLLCSYYVYRVALALALTVVLRETEKVTSARKHSLIARGFLSREVETRLHEMRVRKHSHIHITIRIHSRALAGHEPTADKYFSVLHIFIST